MRESPPPPAWRPVMAVALIAALSAYGAIMQFGITDRAASAFPDPYHVMELQERVQPVLAQIPVTQRVGYFSDIADVETAGRAAYFAAQYAFAPRIVVHEGSRAAPEAVYWLGVLSEKKDLAQVGAARGLSLDRDLGNLVFLFRRQGARP